MQTYLIYAWIFIAAFLWQAFCDYKGYTFWEMLTCLALGLIGAVAVGRYETPHGLAGILAGSIAGFLIGYFSSIAFWIVFWSPYSAFKWWKKRRLT